MGQLEDFTQFRQRLNEKILKESPLEIKRFFALDNQTYQPGALDKKTKELMGLVASMVLRCDDCIRYHIIESKNAGATLAEFYETFTIALIVGGSIIIPHLRRAVDFLDESEQKK